jgi:hypothetical protein
MWKFPRTHIFESSIGHMGGGGCADQTPRGIFDVNRSKLSRTNRLFGMRFLAASR